MAKSTSSSENLKRGRGSWGAMECGGTRDFF